VKLLKISWSRSYENMSERGRYRMQDGEGEGRKGHASWIPAAPELRTCVMQTSPLWQTYGSHDS